MLAVVSAIACPRITNPSGVLEVVVWSKVPPSNSSVRDHPIRIAIKFQIDIRKTPTNR